MSASNFGNPPLVRVLPIGLLLACACVPRTADPDGVTPTLAAADAQTSVRTLLDELDALVAAETATEDDRVFAYERAKAIPDDGSAEYAFGRAALAGRLAELRGLGAGGLVTEAEGWARKSIERDPEYGEGEARRMLGTLYVLAPGRLVEHGDSEEGLAMLEALVEAHPDDPRNHLRVAEAYLALGDPGPATAHLCRVLAERTRLRGDDQRLLVRLVKDAGGESSLACGESG